MPDGKSAHTETELLTADAVEEFFSGDDRTTVDLYIPEWKKTIRLRQLSAADHQALQDLPKADVRTTWISLCVVDANGDRLFKDHERLKSRSIAVLERIFEEALKLNGLWEKVSAVMAASAKNG